VVREGFGSVVISCSLCQKHASSLIIIISYLERLCVPVTDFLDGRHLIEAIREISKLLNAMRETDGQLFGQEL